MISDLVSEDLVQLGVEASDWHDAIRKAAKPLLKSGKITDNYIDSIVQSMQEAGPYFVLVPHVALPHARPETGVLENAIGVTVLKNPIEFGNESNDPVKYIFTLSAKENSSHLDALADLANLFEDAAFFKVLDEAAAPAEVMAYLQAIHKDKEV